MLYHKLYWERPQGAEFLLGAAPPGFLFEPPLLSVGSILTKSQICHWLSAALLLLLLQAFLSELYVYLIDEMHVGLNKALSVEDQRPTPPPLTTTTQLKHFAREAEVNGRLEQAARFYQEVSCIQRMLTFLSYVMLPPVKLCGNSFSVCLSVCTVRNAITFESLDIEISFLVCGYTFRGYCSGPKFTNDLRTIL